ncbi:MAG: hypothetical protein AAF772_12960 [Acidobacteriota bacterium]
MALQPIADDPSIKHFETALADLYAHKFAKAAKGFEKVLEKSDRRQLSDRARQFLALCASRTDDENEVDPYLAAVHAQNAGDFDAARAICDAQAKKDDDGRFAFIAAAAAALAGDGDAAVAHLETAIARDPHTRVHAFHDPDFDALRSRDDFKQLLAASSGRGAA